MKSKWTNWTVSKTPIDPANKEYCYTVCRVRIDGIDHSGNREVAGCYDSMEEANEVKEKMNEAAYIESKQRLCDLILPVLKETRNFSDLVALEYKPGTQHVIATFENGAQKEANVAHDSSAAMIIDIIRQIT